MTTRTKIISGVLALGALAVFQFTGCGEKSAAGFQASAPPVIAATAISRNVPVYLDEIGTCVAREFVSIQPQVSGKIVRIHFADGSDLKTGDTLFTIDPRPYEAALQSAQADEAQAVSGLNLAKLQYDRSSQLLEQKLIAQSDFDSATNTLDAAKAQLEKSKAAVATARLNLDFCFIRSPIDGRAGKRTTDIGNVVSPSSGPLLTIERIDPIYADFAVDENDLPEVKRNLAAGTMSVEVRVPDGTDSAAVGKLTFLDNAVQSGTGTIQMRGTIPNPGRRLWPGQFVHVRLVLRTIQNAVLVPSAAALTSATGSYVLVIKQDSTAEMRPVTVGQRQGDLLVIDKGLNAGERVIVNGALAVMPGAKVNVTATHPADSVMASAAGAN